MGPITEKSLETMENPESYTVAHLSSQQLSSVPDYILQNYKLTSLDLNYNYLDHLPDVLCDSLQQLTFISLSGNSIYFLPKNISNLTQLKELYANENGMQGLPIGIYKLKHLTKLHLMANLIPEVHTSVSDLDNLIELIMDENCLKTLPESFGNLEKLERFEASYNYITTLPESFGKLSKLKFLNLSNNNISKLPESFSNLPSLLELDLSDNKLNDLSETFQSAHLLQKFFVDNNVLCAIPKWFGDLKNIIHLSMKGNNIKKSFPEDFGNICKKLKHIDLSGNYVDILPESFSELENLEFLDMGSTFDEVERTRRLQNGNFLSNLPLNFGNLCSLHQLYLDENSIESLPESFGDLVNLEYLDLSHNHLCSLPNSFGKLISLEVCLLSINYIKYLPMNFGELHNMKELRLDDNQLSELPPSFCKLKRLKILDLYKNVLEELPAALKFCNELTHLDLSENEFEISWEDLENPSVNQIQTESGKFEEFYTLGINGTKIMISQEKEDEVLKMTKEQLIRIRNALKEGSAIWRRHREGNEGKIQRPDDEAEELWDDCLKNNDIADKNATLENVDEKFNNDIFRDDDSSDEWEEKVIGSGQYSFGDPLEITPTDQFLPADIHPPPIERLKINFIVEHGQFDDA